MKAFSQNLFLLARMKGSLQNPFLLARMKGFLQNVISLGRKATSIRISIRKKIKKPVSSSRNNIILKY